MQSQMATWSRSGPAPRLRLRDCVTNADNLSLDSAGASLLSPAVNGSLSAARGACACARFDRDTDRATSAHALASPCVTCEHPLTRHTRATGSLGDGEWPFAALPSPSQGAAAAALAAAAGPAPGTAGTPGGAAPSVLAPLHCNVARAAGAAPGGAEEGGAAKPSLALSLQLPAHPDQVRCGIAAWLLCPWPALFSSAQPYACRHAGTCTERTLPSQASQVIPHSTRGAGDRRKPTIAADRRRPVAPGRRSCARATRARLGRAAPEPRDRKDVRRSRRRRGAARPLLTAAEQWQLVHSPVAPPSHQAPAGRD